MNDDTFDLRRTPAELRHFQPVACESLESVHCCAGQERNERGRSADEARRQEYLFPTLRRAGDSVDPAPDRFEAPRAHPVGERVA
ncbi:MAG TPA: hypothetical protein VGN51_06875 [Acidimicrobiia bacterium]